MFLELQSSGIMQDDVDGISLKDSGFLLKDCEEWTPPTINNRENKEGKVRIRRTIKGGDIRYVVALVFFEMVHQLTNEQMLRQSASVILFISDDSSSSNECNLVMDLMEEVEGDYGAHLSFWFVKDDKALFESFSITSIPSVVFVAGGAGVREEIAERVAGANPSLIMSSLKKAAAAEKDATMQVSIDDRLTALIGQERLMLFIKGSPMEPRCGFTRQLMQLLAEANINSFGSFDILQDMEVRQALKARSNWPTYPQIYLDGEFIGGLDIMKEMREDASMWASFMAKL